MSDSAEYARVKRLLEPFMAERNAGFWCPDGWLALALETHSRLLVADPGYRIMQVKETFGALKYYISTPYTDLTRAIVAGAEARSASVCQNCGAPGAGSVDAGWVATLCDECVRSPDWARRGY